MITKRLLLLLLALLVRIPPASADADDVVQAAQAMFEDHSAVMLLIEPRTGAILRANQAAVAYYGWDQQTLESMLIQDINTLTAEQVAEERARAASQARNYFVFRHRLANSDIRTVEVRSSPIHWQGVDSLLSIVTDIEEREALRDAFASQQSHLEETIEQQTSQIRSSSWRIVLATTSLTILALLLAFTFGFSRRRLRRAEAESREQHRRLGDVLVATGIGTWEWAPRSATVQVNERFGAIIGRPGRGLSTMSLQQLVDLVHPEDHTRIEREIFDHYHGHTERIEFDGRLAHKDGEWVWVRCRGRIVSRGPDGKPAMLAGTIRDISDQKSSDEKLYLKANYDALTGLPNRDLLVDRMLLAMRQAERNNESLAIAFIDLDDFKPVNDEHGHEVGDEVLVKVAARMLGTLREGDTLARLGGDEFVALLPGCGSRDQVAKINRRLLSAASESMHIGDHRIMLGASIGLTLYPQDQILDADQLIRQADQAMYTAKATGKNRVEYFDTEQHQTELRATGDCREFFAAMDRGDVRLYYQPKVNMHSGELVGAEALIRWQHPHRGLLFPGDFLECISTQQQARMLGEWVLRRALEQINTWENSGFHCPVSINIDVRHLQAPDFAERLGMIIGEFPAIPDGQLEIEILETGALEETTLARGVLPRCRELGVRVALDDFGTGYSSLSYLKSVQADNLKVDHSFVIDMLTDADDLSIIKGVLGLAAAFNRQVIAEGVESEAHGTMLLRMGCSIGQGHFIGEAMPAADLLAWARTWTPPRSWIDTDPLPREEHPLLFAQVEVRGWHKSIKAYLRGEGSRPRPNLLRSGLDSWLKGPSAKALRNQPEIFALYRIQEQFHELAGFFSGGHLPDPEEGHLRDLEGLCDEAEPLFEAAIQSSLLIHGWRPRVVSNLR